MSAESAATESAPAESATECAPVAESATAPEPAPVAEPTPVEPTPVVPTTEEPHNHHNETTNSTTTEEVTAMHAKNLLKTGQETPKAGAMSYVFGFFMICTFVGLFLIGTQYDKLKRKIEFKTEGLTDYLLLDDKKEHKKYDDYYPTIRDI